MKPAADVNMSAPANPCVMNSRDVQQNVHAVLFHTGKADGDLYLSRVHLTGARLLMSYNHFIWRTGPIVNCTVEKIMTQLMHNEINDPMCR